jgi:hypothetical protein
VKEIPEENGTRKAGTKRWLKRLGLAGFLFFLVKGLVWIAVGIFAVKGCGQ